MLMNIAKIMIPRACTVFLNENQTVRQGWEVMTRNGYTAIPVLDAEQHYIGTVSEAIFYATFSTPAHWIKWIWKTTESESLFGGISAHPSVLMQMRARSSVQP